MYNVSFRGERVPVKPIRACYLRQLVIIETVAVVILMQQSRPHMPDFLHGQGKYQGRRQRSRRYLTGRALFPRLLFRDVTTGAIGDAFGRGQDVISSSLGKGAASRFSCFAPFPTPPPGGKRRKSIFDFLPENSYVVTRAALAGYARSVLHGVRGYGLKVRRAFPKRHFFVMLSAQRPRRGSRMISSRRNVQPPHDTPILSLTPV